MENGMENIDRRDRYVAAISESRPWDNTLGAVTVNELAAGAAMAVADEELEDQRRPLWEMRDNYAEAYHKVKVENERLRAVINERSRQLQEADETARRLRTELTQVTEHRDLILRWNVDTAATAERDEVEIDSLRAEIARLRTELAEERRKH